MGNNKLLAFGAIVVVCLVIAAVPIAIMTSQDNNSEEEKTFTVTITDTTGDPIKWDEYVTEINDGATAKSLNIVAERSGSSVICKVDPTMLQSEFTGVVEPAIEKAMGDEGYYVTPPIYQENNPITEAPSWEICYAK